jgi:hypothetical protein
MRKIVFATTIIFVCLAYVFPQNNKTDGSNWGNIYLQWFYPTLANTPGLEFAMGGVWAGFDDRPCSWGEHRWIDRREGEVYDSTWLMAAGYSGDLPLLWMYIETWNDWNEGTKIEPCTEYGYSYLESTVRNINEFKRTDLDADTCLYFAAGKIYKAADMIERGQGRDSVYYYPLLERAIKSYLHRNCIDAISVADSILENKLGNCLSDITEIQSDAIKIFPNPVIDYLHIELPVKQTVHIQIIDMEGNIIVHGQFDDKTVSINVHNLPAGVYFVKINYNKGLIMKKIVFAQF